jgi:hypothetical protein
VGWKAIYKDGTIKNEEDINEDGLPKWGRPVEDGNNGLLLCIAQEDYGHKIAVDLINGIIALEYDEIGVQNGTVELHNPKIFLWICDETNIVGELRHVKTTFPFARDEDGKKILHEGKYVKVKNDEHIPLTWRPIWFTRYTDGVPTKIIGAQTTQPKEQDNRNAKKMVSIFIDGRLGID